jgi:hypothetical protein
MENFVEDNLYRALKYWVEVNYPGRDINIQWLLDEIKSNCDFATKKEEEEDSYSYSYWRGEDIW